MTHPAVFLDRDGTIIEDVGYLDRLERLKLFPYTMDAVRLLNRAGYRVFVVTSQNGIAQGVLTEEFLGQAHAHLSALCEAVGATRYVNPIGGLELYSKGAFAARGIELLFLRSHPLEYAQYGADFVPQLSILDVLMFNPLPRVREIVFTGYDVS